MASRFDNYSAAEIAEMEALARRELDELRRALRDKMEAENPFQIGRAYRIVSGRYAGRVMRVDYVVASAGGIAQHIPRVALAEGPLWARKTLHGGPGWNIRPQQTEAANLEKTPMECWPKANK